MIFFFWENGIEDVGFRGLSDWLPGTFRKVNDEAGSLSILCY